MQQTALEDKVQNLAAEYIYEQAVGSLLLLLMSAMEDAEKGEQPLPYPIHEDVLTLKKEVRRALLSLKDTLDAPAAQREAVYTTCVELKEKLIAIYENIYSYSSQWNLYSTLVGDQVALRKYKEEQIDLQKMDFSLFFADCHTFMADTHSEEEQKANIGHILKCIPLRMARNKYYDMVYQSLDTAFAGQSKPYIAHALKIFQNFCCPQNMPSYGTYFPELAKWSEEHLQTMPQDLSDDALAALYEDMQKIYEQMGEIEEYFSCILHDINSLIILHFLTYSFADLTEKDTSYADLYETVCEFLTNEMDALEKDAYLDTIKERLEQAVEPNIDRANEIEKEERGYLQKIDDFHTLSEDTKKMLVTQDIMREYFFADLDEEIFRDIDFGEEAPASDAERKELIAEFIEHIRGGLEATPAPLRKLAMQQLMGALVPVYTVEEVMELLQSAIDNAATLEQKILIVNKIGTIFDELGYVSIANTHMDDDCGCGHDHAHHDHCDCGHDHAHHDHCDCGHDHHHHDHCDCGHDHH